MRLKILKKILFLLFFLISFNYGHAFLNNNQIENRLDFFHQNDSKNNIIKHLYFFGNNHLNSKEIEQLFLNFGLQKNNDFNELEFYKIKEYIIKKYKKIGFLEVDLIYKIFYHSDGFVTIKLKVSEGNRTILERVNFLREKSYLQDLNDNLTKYLSFKNFVNNILFNKSNASAIETKDFIVDVANFYLENGYLDFQIINQDFLLLSSAKKKDFFVNLNVFEGKKYKISKVEFHSSHRETDFSELYKNINLLKFGSDFSIKNIFDTSLSIQKILNNNGYPFVVVNPFVKINFENNSIVLIFNIDSGKKYTINQVKILGNNLTKEYVYKNKIDDLEKSVYNENLLDQSIAKLKELSFVDEVKVHKILDLNENDSINLEFLIKEKNANTLSTNLGYSELYNYTMGSNLYFPNLWGQGKQLSFSSSISKIHKSLDFSYNNPYFTRYGINESFSGYSSKTNYGVKNGSYYYLDKYGLNLEYKFPFKIFNSFYLGSGFDQTQILQFDNGFSSVLEFFNRCNGYKKKFNTFNVNFGWTYSSINKIFFPEYGSNINLNIMASLPVSDLKWYKIFSSINTYHPFIYNSVFSVKSSIGFGDGYGSTQYLPFFQNFSGGGWGSIRGFSQSSLGGIDMNYAMGHFQEKGSVIGGNISFYTNIDLLFPLKKYYVISNEDIILGCFFDVGNVYNGYYKLNNFLWRNSNINNSFFSNLRSSIGFQLKYNSPMGSMSFSIAKPMNVQTGDSIQIFQFSLN